MSNNEPPFTAVAAMFFNESVAPLLTAFLVEDAAMQRAVPDEGRDTMRTRLVTWLDDIKTGHACAALAPERLVKALETIWLLSIVAVQTPPDQADPDWVDILVTPTGARVTALAVAATGALDTLRGTDVANTFGGQQLAHIERFAAIVGAEASSRNLH